jgi:hypothetical protein
MASEINLKTCFPSDEEVYRCLVTKTVRYSGTPGTAGAKITEPMRSAIAKISLAGTFSDVVAGRCYTRLALEHEMQRASASDLPHDKVKIL